MATGWAVGAAATMGLSVALLVRADPATVETPALLAFLLPFVFAGWTYAVSMAAHGSRGALVALAGYAAVGGMGLGALHLAACLPGLACGAPDLGLRGLTVLVGALSALATLGEAMRRRGPVHGATAAFLLAPLAVAVLLHVAVALV